MLSMLRRSKLDTKTYSQRTYIVSSGDAFSARKAAEFEQEIHRRETETAAGKCDTASHAPIGKGLEPDKLAPMDGICSPSVRSSYVVVTVPRARNVHQSFLTTPFSTLHCLWESLRILQGRHPDQIRTLNPLRTPNVGRKGEHVTHSSTPTTSAVEYPGVILTNGPGTAVCVIVAAHLLRIINDFLPIICLRLLGIRPRQDPNSMSTLNTRYLRTIFVESWARVTTLSLSGRIVLPLVDRFLVQWEHLEGYSSWLGGRAEYAGTLVC